MEKQIDLGNGYTMSLEGDDEIEIGDGYYSMTLSRRQFRMMCDYLRDETGKRGEAK